MSWCRGKSSPRQMCSSSSPLPLHFFFTPNPSSLSFFLMWLILLRFQNFMSLSFPFDRGRADLFQKGQRSMCYSMKKIPSCEKELSYCVWLAVELDEGKAGGNQGTGQGERRHLSPSCLWDVFSVCCPVRKWVCVLRSMMSTVFCKGLESRIQGPELFAYNNTCIKNTLKYALSTYLSLLTAFVLQL